MEEREEAIEHEQKDLVNFHKVLLWSARRSQGPGPIFSCKTICKQRTEKTIIKSSVELQK